MDLVRSFHGHALHRCDFDSEPGDADSGRGGIERRVQESLREYVSVLFEPVDNEGGAQVMQGRFQELQRTVQVTDFAPRSNGSD